MELLNLSRFKLTVDDKILIDNSKNGSNDFIVNSGDLVLIVGANGTGKTTLMKKIIGISNLTDEKNVHLDIESLESSAQIEDITLEDVAYSPNDSDLKLVLDERLKMKDYLYDILMGKYKENIEEIKRLFQAFYGEEYEHFFKSRIVRCSSGEQKKLSIISALIKKDKKIYFFDEPMNCLDTKSMLVFMNELEKLRNKQPESAIVIITHCLLFDNPTKVYKISNKVLIDDTKNYRKRDCLDYLLK